ncbi:MAG: rhodanese-like domain-containing protein [Pseudomonadota bacterium]
MPIFSDFLVACCFFSASLSAAAACGTTHIVQTGDTLSGLAREKVGSVFGYQLIYDANRDIIGDNPNLILAGAELTIPCAPSAIEDVNWSVMPTAPVVDAILRTEDIQILDIRSEKQVADGVIPGSISVPFAWWRGPPSNPGSPPTAPQLSAIIGAAGLDLDRPIVIVNSVPTMMDLGRASMVYWLLKSSGAENLAILRDGFKSWDVQGFPVAAKPITPTPRIVDVQFSGEWHASIVDIYGIATDQVNGHLLDARPHSVFRRVDAAGEALANTIPGARNAPIQTLMSTLAGHIDIEDGVDDVVAHLVANRADWAQGPVVTFCNTGEVGALSWFYASELAGLDNMRLYPDSVRGWATSGGVLATGDG